MMKPCDQTNEKEERINKIFFFLLFSEDKEKRSLIIALRD